MNNPLKLQKLEKLNLLVTKMGAILCILFTSIAFASEQQPVSGKNCSLHVILFEGKSDVDGNPMHFGEKAESTLLKALKGSGVKGYQSVQIDRRNFWDFSPLPAETAEYRFEITLNHKSGDIMSERTMIEYSFEDYLHPDSTINNFSDSIEFHYGLIFNRFSKRSVKVALQAAEQLPNCILKN